MSLENFQNILLSGKNSLQKSILSTSTFVLKMYGMCMCFGSMCVFK